MHSQAGQVPSLGTPHCIRISPPSDTEWVFVMFQVNIFAPNKGTCIKSEWMQCAFCLVKGIFLHISHYFAGKKSCLILIKAARICIMAGSYEPFHLIKHTHCLGYHITLTPFCPFSIYHNCNINSIIITKLLCVLLKIRNYLMRLRSLILRFRIH